jgi:hypothetical protein
VKDFAHKDSGTAVNTNTGVVGSDEIGIPELWWSAIAALLIPVSLIWDYSWECTIGVDRIWSPPHLATHVGIWLSGLIGLQLIARFTLARHRRQFADGVNLGSFCGPTGAWILLWGAATMQCAFLFDSWWQQAYGLGAGLWHPPQILKATAFFTVLLGGIALAAAAKSRDHLKSATAFLIWNGGLFLTLCALVLAMTNLPNAQHTAGFVEISSALYPGILLAVGAASRTRWGMAGAALVYLLVSGAMVWVLPLFSAHPLTAPIHNPMDHMMPPSFPLLLIVPALVMDWLRGQFADGAGWRAEIMQAGSLGLGFVATFLPAQWFFASFLLSPAADNWFFAGGGRHWPFFLKIDQARVMFWGTTQDPMTWRTVLWASMLAIFSTEVGFRIGKWLRNLCR